jgi:hypothetical protein
MIRVTTIPASNTPKIKVTTGDRLAIIAVAFVEISETKLLGSVGIILFSKSFK